MTPLRLLPGLLICHDDFARSVAKRITPLLAGAGSAVTVADVDSFDPTSASDALADVGALQAFAVIHLVGPIQDVGVDEEAPSARANAIAGEVNTVRTSLNDQFPSKGRFDQWVVMGVGQRLDQSETELIDHLLAAANDIRGVLVCASGSSASVVHTVTEQTQFAADAAVSLLGTELEARLADSDNRAWAVGSTSLSYSRHAFAQAVAASGTLPVIERIVEGTGRNSPSFDEGVEWARELDLLDDSERSFLLESATGSLGEKLRFPAPDWNEVPIVSWVDVLVTIETMLRTNVIPLVEREIDKSREVRLDELRRSSFRACLQHFDANTRIAGAVDFAEGAATMVESFATDIANPPANVDRDDIDNDIALLHRLTKWLPFGPAVAIRLFALALAALVFLAPRLGESGLPVLERLSEGKARGMAALILVVGTLLYQRRVSKTLRVRDRLRRNMELWMQDQVELLVAQGRRATIGDLRAWIGKRPDWYRTEPDDGDDPACNNVIDWWAHHDRALRRVKIEMLQRLAAYIDIDTDTSRFAATFPDPTNDNDPAALYERVTNETVDVSKEIRSYAVALGTHDTSAPLNAVPHAWNLHYWTNCLAASALRSTWQTLGALLTDQPQSAERGRRIIEADTTPAVSHTDHERHTDTRHYLVCPGGSEGTEYQRLFEVDNGQLPEQRVTTRLTQTLTGRFAGVVQMIHLFALGSNDHDAGHPT